MAMRIDISVGYLSQIDRPVPAPVLMTLTREFPADWAASTPPRHRYLPIPTGNSSSTPASRKTALFSPAHQLARIELDGLIGEIVAASEIASETGLGLLAAGLTNYAAGALGCRYALPRPGARSASRYPSPAPQLRDELRTDMPPEPARDGAYTVP
jgi:hypothetical protein